MSNKKKIGYLALILSAAVCVAAPTASAASEHPVNDLREEIYQELTEEEMEHILEGIDYDTTASSVTGGPDLSLIEDVSDGLTDFEKVISAYVVERYIRILNGTDTDWMVLFSIEDCLPVTTYTYEQLGLFGTYGEDFTDEDLDIVKNSLYSFDVKSVIEAVKDVSEDGFLYWTSYRIAYGNWIRYEVDNEAKTVTFTGNVAFGYVPAGDYAVDGEKYKVNARLVKEQYDRILPTIDAVVAATACYSDYDKLRFYHDYICEAVEYNDDAAEGNSHEYYDREGNGNPWSILPVFDNDDTTNVVCEGYSKAFKILCDRTDFSRKISSILVSGDAGGPHMWNNVAMDDGRNYLMDVTWSDGGGDYFLIPTEGGSVADGYWYYEEIRTYDKLMTKLYSEDRLEISENDYEIPEEPEYPELTMDGEGKTEVTLDVTDASETVSTYSFTCTEDCEFTGYVSATSARPDNTTIEICDAAGNRILFDDGSGSEGSAIVRGTLNAGETYLIHCGLKTLVTGERYKFQFFVSSGDLRVVWDYPEDGFNGKLCAYVNTMEGLVSCGYLYAPSSVEGGLTLDTEGCVRVEYLQLEDLRYAFYLDTSTITETVYCRAYATFAGEDGTETTVYSAELRLG